MKSKPWLFRCSNGFHQLITYGVKGSGWPPKQMPCYFMMSVWVPERGRVRKPCTGTLLRRGWRERDYVLSKQST